MAKFQQNVLFFHKHSFKKLWQPPKQVYQHPRKCHNDTIVLTMKIKYACEPTEYARGCPKKHRRESNERNMRENIKAIEQNFQQEILDIQQNLQLLQSTSERRTTTERSQFACIPTRTSVEHATRIST